MSEKYIFTPFLSGNGSVEEILKSLSSDLSGGNILVSTYIETLSTRLSSEIVALSADLSTAISSKIWINDLVDRSLVSSSSDLSIIKINKDAFDQHVALSSDIMSVNTLYIVNSNYVDAYGQAISNVIMSASNLPSEAYNPSEATNKNYVDALCTSISVTTNLSIESLSTRLSNEVKDIKNLFSNLSSNHAISSFYNIFNGSDGINEIEIQLAVSALYNIIKIFGY